MMRRALREPDEETSESEAETWRLAQQYVREREVGQEQEMRARASAFRGEAGALELRGMWKEEWEGGMSNLKEKEG